MKTLIARQPIFLADESIAGYGILYHRVPGGAVVSDDERANAVLVQALLGLGLERVAGGQPAFIGVTREVLLGGTLETLDPTAIIIRLLETVEADVAVLDACRHLVGLGYTILLDRFTHTARNESLLPSARIVGLDVSEYSPVELTMQVALLRPFGVDFLGQNVQDAATHTLCLELGFRFFEGHYLSTPEAIDEDDVGVARVRAFRALRLLRDNNSSDHAIEEEFRRDVALSFRLLRIVNSAAIGGQGIRSIHHAIRLLGREALQRWLSLLLIPQEVDSGVEREKLKSALTRARFCESLANAGRRPIAAGTLFLVGILSSLDTYFGVSLDSVLRRLDLATEVSAALVGHRGPFGAALALVAAYQVGDWDEVVARCEDMGVDEDSLTSLYLDSLAWAQERLDDMAAETHPHERHAV
jgi:EAL and modified HD-GYP domain-containing signal transduction protein